MPLLQPLNNEQITKLADALDSVIFKPDQYIIRQGEQVISRLVSVYCTADLYVELLGKHQLAVVPYGTMPSASRIRIADGVCMHHVPQASA